MIPFNNRTPKAVSGMGRRDVIKLPNKKIRVVACVWPVKYAIRSTVSLLYISRLEKYARMICQLLSVSFQLHKRGPVYEVH
jgi:hypothetical protein